MHFRRGAAVGAIARRADVGRGRSRLQQQRPLSACLGSRPTASHPAEEQRSACRLPRTDRQPPQPRRTPLGEAQGVARRRNPLREDRRVLSCLSAAACRSAVPFPLRGREPSRPRSALASDRDVIITVPSHGRGRATPDSCRSFSRRKRMGASASCCCCFYWPPLVLHCWPFHSRVPIGPGALGVRRRSRSRSTMPCMLAV